MPNEIDASIEIVISRIKAMPSRLDAALKSVEDKLQQIAHELSAAQVLADTIINSATVTANEIKEKTKVLAKHFKSCCEEIAKA